MLLCCCAPAYSHEDTVVTLLQPQAPRHRSGARDTQRIFTVTR